MVMAQTLFITIKRQHSGAVIDVIAPSWSSPILKRMPEIRHCIEMPLGHGQLGLCVRRKIGKSLQAEHYNQAIILTNSFKSALIPFWADIPVRIGWRGEMRYGLLNDIRILNKEQLPLMVERFIALGLTANAPIPSELPKPNLHVEPDAAKSSLHRHRLQTNKPVLGICPGSEFGPSKQWPASYYSEAALHMIKNGWQVWLFGSEKDRPITTAIIDYIPNQHQSSFCNLAGETSLADAVDLLSLTSAVITNDSGLMHIAAALSRPLVAIYGSTSTTHTPPINTNSETIWLGLECSPCFKRTCPLGHHNCMQQLTPSNVISSLEQLLKKEATIATSKIYKT